MLRPQHAARTGAAPPAVGDDVHSVVLRLLPGHLLVCIHVIVAVCFLGVYLVQFILHGPAARAKAAQGNILRPVGIEARISAEHAVSLAGCPPAAIGGCRRREVSPTAVRVDPGDGGWLAVAVEAAPAGIDLAGNLLLALGT